ncbi:MAG: hypothetical protein ACYS8Z_02175 [Planctomycetota bacterium]|jgi:hypothetical protein
MADFGVDALCKQAELYYYDILYDKGDKPIPPSIIAHIDDCRNCREQLKQLEAALSQAYGSDSEQGGSDSVTTAMLQLHLAHTSRLVTCETIKPFIPTLLHQDLRVAIPTPITVHLDNCKACSQDLKTIKSLNLSPKQLIRLSRFFAEKSTEEAVSCAEAQAIGLSESLLLPGTCDAAVLRHLCACGDCRKAVYQHHESLREELLGNGIEQSESSCAEIAASDIFDYCVPYGIDPTNDQYVESHKSFASHILNCSTCLGKWKQLHNVVYGIAERHNSEVATIYRIAGAAEVLKPADSGDPYAGFPISVEIADSNNRLRPEKPVSGRRASGIRLRPFAKIAAIAAAVIIVAALFFNAPSARAITLAEVYEALENVRNVYIAHFVSGREEPVQEQWVSRSIGLYLIETEKQAVLRDIPGRQMKVRGLGSNLPEAMPMSSEMLADTDKKMRGSLGLVPFAETSMLPKGATWNPANDRKSDADGKGVEVYELTWVQDRPGLPSTMRKWRFFVDVETGLPRRVELYRKSSDDTDYELKSSKTAEYLSDVQIREVVEERFPAGDISLGQPERMPVLIDVPAFSD